MSVKSDGQSTPYVELNGVKYRLASIPSSKEAHAKLAAPSFAANVPLIPESDWRVIDNSQSMPWTMDQKSHGSCVGHGAAGGLMGAREYGGAAHIDLSGAYVYSFINGNRDDGASIADAIAVLLQHGTCTYQRGPWDKIYRKNYTAADDQEAARFKALEIFKAGADPWNELGTGVQLGYTVVYAVMVGNSFMSLDADGVCGFDRGPGNHCVHGRDLKKRANGETLLGLKNSWGVTFGQNGLAFVTRKHVESVQQDWYLIRAAAEDPQEPNEPPVIVN